MAIHVVLVVELFLWSMLCVNSQDSDDLHEGSGVWNNTGNNDTDYWTMIDDEDYVEEMGRMTFFQVKAIPSIPCDSWIREVDNQMSLIASFQEAILQVVDGECQCRFDISNGSVVCVDNQLPKTHIVYTVNVTRPIEFSTNEDFLLVIQQWAEMGPTIHVTLDTGETITLEVVTSVEEDPTVAPPSTTPGDTPPGDENLTVPPGMTPGDENVTVVPPGGNVDFDLESSEVKSSLCIGVLMFGAIFAQFVPF